MSEIKSFNSLAIGEFDPIIISCIPLSFTNFINFPLTFGAPFKGDSNLYSFLIFVIRSVSFFISKIKHISFGSKARLSLKP